MAKKKFYTSPRGKFLYPWLNKPDTKFNKGGVFKVDLVVEQDDAEEIKELIDNAVDTRYDEQIEKAKPADKKKIKKTYPYEMECDDEGDETGNLVIKFKMNHTVEVEGKDPWTQSPALFDRFGQKLEQTVYGGSVGVISFELIPYYFGKDKEAGVSLRLRAVQVLELVTGGQASAETYGFEAEDAPEESDGDTSGDFSSDNEEEDDDF